MIMVVAIPLLWVLSLVDEKCGFSNRFADQENIQTVVSVVSSYAFTLLGFLVAFVSILLGLSNSETIKRYGRQGNLKSFIVLVAFTLFVLSVLFGASLYLLADPSWMFLVIYGSVLSLIQVGALMWVVLIQVHKAVSNG